MSYEKDHSASLAEVVSAGAIASDAAPHDELCDEVACRGTGCWQCDPQPHKLVDYVLGRLSILRSDLEWHRTSVRSHTRDKQILFGSSIRAEQIETEINILIELGSFIRTALAGGNQAAMEPAVAPSASEAQKSSSQLASESH